MFKDPWNPTQDEIKAWAYSDMYAPDQDFELAVNTIGNIPMICGFINDPTCNKHKFFLSSLYVCTGDIVRVPQENQKAEFERLLEQLSNGDHSLLVQEWITRSLHLVQNPDTYSYEYWGLDSKFVYPKRDA